MAVPDKEIAVPDRGFAVPDTLAWRPRCVTCRSENQKRKYHHD
jgi:hypothetical protein